MIKIVTLLLYKLMTFFLSFSKLFKLYHLPKKERVLTMASSLFMPSSIVEEEARFEAEVAEVQAWWNSERFKLTKRPYSARDVVSLRGNLRQTYGSDEMAKKLWRILKNHQANGTASRTFGALDPVQVTQMAKHLDTIYVSGWQCSATHTTTNEPGPDLADYPYDTVPNKVEHLFFAQQYHDRKQKEERMNMSREERARTPYVDYLRPIIADGDTGKVLVAISEHINRLVAARLQFDVMGVETVLVARTDAEAANLVQSNIDTRDHQFILGVTNPNLRGKSLATLMAKDMAAGKSGAELQALEDEWLSKAQLKTLSEAVVEAIGRQNIGEEEKRRNLNEWMHHSSYERCLSNEEGREIAERLGVRNLFWDWDLPRTREGFYRFKGSVTASVVRGWAFAPHADVIWMETASPNVAECTEFAEGVRSKYPEMMLGYNLSPSFNWDASGMSDEQMRDFIPKIAKLGYVWQFITVGGLHSNALITSTFSRDFANRGMLAYVERIQREERNNGVDTLAHQKWAGANYYDRYLKTVQGGVASTAAMGKGKCLYLQNVKTKLFFPFDVFVGVTEDQFKESWTRPGAVDIDRGSIVVAKARM
ncbi:hypothetical protein ACSQ67_023484 [Phaseolus vulgaris]